MGPRLVAAVLVLGSLVLAGCGEGGNAPEDSIAGQIKAANIDPNGGNGGKSAPSGKIDKGGKPLGDVSGDKSSAPAGK